MPGPFFLLFSLTFVPLYNNILFMVTGRPKGSGKWSNPDYIDSLLPDNVKVKRPVPIGYDWEISHTFIDPVYGEWTTSPRTMITKGYSTHPKRVALRRKEYYKNNPDKLKQIRSKAVATTKQRYSKAELLEKAKAGNLKKWGTEWASQSESFRKAVRSTNIERYGVENPMQNDAIKQKNFDNTAKNNTYESSGEKELRLYIEELGFTTSKISLDFKQFDICIEDKKLLIEYNGLYFHNTDNPKINPGYHNNKTKIAEKHGYRLIHIFDKEWVTQKEKIKFFLKSALGANSTKIYARNTEIKVVDKEISRQFLNQYHLLGSVAHNIAYGLYYNNELVSLITLNYHHRGSDSRMVVNRFVNKFDTNVVGGLSRLCSYAFKAHGELISWIDRRLATTKNWEAAGWLVEATLPPDYFYYNKKTSEVVSKQSRKKSIVSTPLGMTESEHAKIDGLSKVYDCGKYRLVFRK